MFCKNCGKKSDSDQKFCTNCGALFSKSAESNESIFSESSPPKPKGSPTGKIVGIIVILIIVGFGIYGSLDEDSITQNNEGLTSFESGDSQTAINQLQQASKDAVTSDTKLNTLKNLGYVHSSEGQSEQALQSFREALTYASKGSFDYFLVSGEIALLEGKPNAAQISYNKAYELRPSDFQINNALNLFYLDLSEVAPYYSDYGKALQYAQKAYDVSDDLVKNTARQNLGIAHFFNENYDQAISYFSYTDLNKEPYIAYWLGWAYVAKGDGANAKLYFQKALNAGIELEPEAYEYL
ncbi:tetratricopeptide repeat protein [Patescibacteria group bacterium]|nr:tetratricopeptide repeat protein [Patescibacteria group bacterium]